MKISDFIHMSLVTEGVRSMEVKRAEELADKIERSLERVDTIMGDGMRCAAADVVFASVHTCVRRIIAMSERMYAKTSTTGKIPDKAVLMEGNHRLHALKSLGERKFFESRKELVSCSTSTSLINASAIAAVNGNFLAHRGH